MINTEVIKGLKKSWIATVNGLSGSRTMTRITRRKQEAPKRMKYGENGSKQDPALVAPPTKAEDNDDQNEADNEEEGEDSEVESESSEERKSPEIGAKEHDGVTMTSQSNEVVLKKTLEMTVNEKTSPVSPSSPSLGVNVQNTKSIVWTNGPVNGLSKFSDSDVMDLSAKRRRRSESDESEPEVKLARKSERSYDTQPLDLSQKSSRPRDDLQKRNRPITPVTSHPQTTPISPSLASLQKKFGGQIHPPKTPVDVARGTVDSRPPTSSAHVNSSRNLWYSNVYRQSLAPYSTLFAHSKLPYYPGLSDIPLHASFPALAAAASGISDCHVTSLGSPGNLKQPKATNHHSVAMTTKSQPSINSSPSKSHRPISLPPKQANNTTPPIPVMTSPMTSPRTPNGPMVSYEVKDVKSNCIDFKCDCNKTYSTLYELSVHMQETGHMPRNTKAGPSGDYPKLVRGQDMWLNNGLEQTKQILRCMHCGESFKTLPELTVHMMKTQHYADIFSSAHRKLHKCTTFFEKENDTKSVFKCRVCENEFDSLDSLASHMVESRHHRRSGRGCLSTDEPTKNRKTLPPSRTSTDECDSRSDGTSPLVSPSEARRIEHSDRFTKPTSNIHDTRERLVSHDSRPLSHDSRPLSHDSRPLSHDSRPLSREDYASRDVTSPANESRDPHIPFDVPTLYQNGDVNHNTDSEKLKHVKSEVTSASETSDTNHISPAVSPQSCRDSPVSDNEDESEHNIKCENCFERIKTDLFVEHVRHCISKDQKSVSSKPETTQVSPPPTLVPPTVTVTQEPVPPPSGEKKQRSALKAMEKFIENFNDRKTKTSHSAPMSSLLYDYVGPMSNNLKSRSPSEDVGRVSSPLDSGNKPLRMPMYMDRAPDHSALHNLYRFASYGSRNSSHTMSRLPESPSRHTISRSPPISPKHSSVTSSHSDDVIRRNGLQSMPHSYEIERKIKVDEELISTSPRHDIIKPTEYNSAPVFTDSRPRDITPPIRSQEERRPISNGAYSPMNDVTTPSPRQATPDVMQERRCPSTSSNKSETPEHSESGTSSALDSLKGLVNKQTDKSEHPLNSLQKLINQTDGNHSSSVASLQSRLINVTSSPYWFSFSHLTKGFQGSHSKPENALDPAVDENVVDSDGIEVKISELKCDICGKLFSSRGGCRYHRSKCPQGVPKNLGTKEARIVQTPYTYMPLEHTNKFSKYYEMARELANKSH